jgi:2-polyprenyl-3-methyl-5-hydroxy-6-metoxy-1,4-benzoquinol methylase
MKNSETVRQFYNAFSVQVLLGDFVQLNPRQQAIKALCAAYLSPDFSALEIGCGAGILTNVLSKHAASVTAVDISDMNITVASEYNRNQTNITFVLQDILTDSTQIEQKGPYDFILFADVIEHVPIEKYRQVFTLVEKILSERGTVVLTLPTPEYQRYLKANKPEALQVVDEEVELLDILRNRTRRPIYGRYQNIWLKNQYMHVVLSRDIKITPKPAPSILQKLLQRANAVVWRISNRGFLRKIKANS